jgi:hypothetical protein
MQKLTIQINNKEALERLIGNDTEVEIDIRNSVVQKFAEKHLKPLANSPAINGTLEAIKADIAKQTREKVEKEIATFKEGYYNSRATDIVLRPEIKAEIERQVRNLTDKTIQDTVDEALKTWLNDAELKKRIDARFEYYTKEHINTEIKSRIEKLKAAI